VAIKEGSKFMSVVTQDQVTTILSEVLHPEFAKSVVELKMVSDVSLTDAHCKVRLDLLTFGSPVRDQLVAEMERHLAARLPGVNIEIETFVSQISTQPALGGGILANVKNIVAVASGKGGVGKSTVASNLAASLVLEGASVGLLDADIYGPSIPALLGVDQASLKVIDKRIQPVEKFGLKIMSMGFLMKPGESVIWRGPMLHGMVQQFCKDVDWGELDFLILDLPPGTGDVSLSLSQLLPIGGAVLVSTPQQVALGVATKAVNMFRKLSVPLVGLVENMSYYSCPHCGQHDDLFGHGGARRAAADMELPFLGEIPLNSAVREAGDIGQPVVISAPDSAPAVAFRDFTRRLAGRLTVAALEGIDEINHNVLPC
jgi:ATP-binding protein involved in chromosome partitioning